MKTQKYNVFIGIAIILLLISTASAASWIYSNWITGEVKPKTTITLELNTTTITEGESFMLKATMNPHKEGSQIEFYWNDTNLIGIGTTDFNGVAWMEFTPTLAGYYNFTSRLWE